ncbi:MAG: YbaN family protein [Candidatus Palauibacterales bacterium]|nr:YbaN family protein [Candidatus Palauibacterales bacterium]
MTREQPRRQPVPESDEGASPSPDPPDPVRSPLIRWTLIGAGGALMAIGVVGVFVPLLPTTCFLLGAAACFARSSTRLYRWLHENGLFGSYLTEYRQCGRIPARVRTATLTILWTTLLATGIWAVTGLLVRGVLVAVGIGVTIHLLALDVTEGDGRRQEPGETPAADP